MLKIEAVWRELLFQSIEKRNVNFRLIDLSKKYRLSLSLVHHAIIPLANLGIVRIGKRMSEIADTQRLLIYWATKRNLNRDVIYRTLSRLSVSETENSLPAEVVPTAYSAYKQIFKDAPADYDKIYYYSNDFEEIQRRFPDDKKGATKIIILKPDPYFQFFEKLTLAHLFVDLWNMQDWYAKDFVQAALDQINLKLGL